MPIFNCLRASTLALLVGVAPETRQARSAALSQPRTVPLVVLIVVDQLRGDLLDRCDTVFTGGFRRLRDRGFRFSKAVVDHAITVCHPGHATIATGMHPTHHSYGLAQIGVRTRQVGMETRMAQRS